MADVKVAELIRVYKATCIPTGMSYIGITCHPIEKRWLEHVKVAMSGKADLALSNAIREHGDENFSLEELEVVEGRDAGCLAERKAISLYQTVHPKGYNLSNGGEGTVGRLLCEKVRDKISKSVSALWEDPEYRARLCVALQNRPTSDAQIKHLRAQNALKKGKPRKPELVARSKASLMGHVISAETRAKISASGKGKHAWSDEKKRRHSERIRALHAAGAYANAGKKAGAKHAELWKDPEFRKNRMTQMIGKHHSDETKEKISQSRKAGIADGTIVPWNKKP